MIIFKRKPRDAIKHGANKSYFVSLSIWRCQTGKPAVPFQLNEGSQCALVNQSKHQSDHFFEIKYLVLIICDQVITLCLQLHGSDEIKDIWLNHKFIECVKKCCGHSLEKVTNFDKSITEYFIVLCHIISNIYIINTFINNIKNE